MVSYYHQVYPLTALRELVLPLTLPWCRTTTKSTHSLSHCLLSHTHSHGVVLPPSHHSHPHQSSCSHSHSHGVVLPPSLLTHTHSHTVFSLTHTPMVSYYHQVITHPHQSLCSHSLPSTMSLHTLLPSLHFTSFSPPTHPNSSPTLSHPSCLHRIIIISSPLPITYHHQSLPLTPHNTPNPSISLPTLPIVS